MLSLATLKWGLMTGAVCLRGKPEDDLQRRAGALHGREVACVYVEGPHMTAPSQVKGRPYLPRPFSIRQHYRTTTFSEAAGNVCCPLWGKVLTLF
jgi:hypothetical protein